MQVSLSTFPIVDLPWPIPAYIANNCCWYHLNLFLLRISLGNSAICIRVVLSEAIYQILGIIFF